MVRGWSAEPACGVSRGDVSTSLAESVVPDLRIKQPHSSSVFLTS